MKVTERKTQNFDLLNFLTTIPEACNFIKKETLAQVLSCEFCEISKNASFTEHLWTTASVFFLLLLTFALQS